MSLLDSTSKKCRVIEAATSCAQSLQRANRAVRVTREAVAESLLADGTDAEQIETLLSAFSSATVVQEQRAQSLRENTPERYCYLFAADIGQGEPTAEEDAAFVEFFADMGLTPKALDLPGATTPDRPEL